MREKNPVQQQHHRGRQLAQVRLDGDRVRPSTCPYDATSEHLDSPVAEQGLHTITGIVTSLWILEMGSIQATI